MITRESFLKSIVAPRVVARAAEALGAEGIAVMPLKGALLQRWVYADAAEREVVDVDLLVRPRDYRRAEAALERAGFRWIRSEEDDWQSVFLHPELPLEVDLHRRLARTRRHRLTAGALFDAGTRDEMLFGVPIVRPDPLDLYAHLVAHASTTYLIAGYLHRARDFGQVAERLGLGPKTCAARLVRRGVVRHARLVLPLVHEATGDPFACRVLERLPPDRLGQGVARAARWGVEAASPRSPFRRMPGILLNPTLAEAGLAVLEAGWQRVRPRPFRGPPPRPFTGP